MIFDKFCCCLSLERGGYVTGLFGILSGISQLIAGFAAFGKKLNMESHYFDIKIGYPFFWLMNMASGILIILCSALLCIGVQKEKPALIIPALIVDLIAMSYELYATVERYFLRHLMDGALLDFLMCLFLLSIFYYFWFCLFRLYCELLKRKTMPII